MPEADWLLQLLAFAPGSEVNQLFPFQQKPEGLQKREATRNAFLGPFSEQYPDRETMHEVVKSIAGWGSGEKVFFNLSIDEIVEAGLRIRGRYWIESAFTKHAVHIGNALAEGIDRSPQMRGERIVLDLFAGTGNLAYHISDSISARKVLCFDSDPLTVDDMNHNFQILGVEADAIWAPFPDSLNLAGSLVGFGQRRCSVLFVVDPPWGEDGFRYETGLDLRKTSPNIGHILSVIKGFAQGVNYAVAVKTHSHLVEQSLVDVTRGWLLERLITVESITPGIGPGVALLFPETPY